MRNPGALFLATLLGAQAASAAAMDLPEATGRLSAIDRDLTTCLKRQLSAPAILPGALRDCIAAARPGDHTLRKELNGWIPSLSDTDPARDPALRTRQDLNTLRAFINALDKALMYRRAAMDPADAETAVQAACHTSRLVPAEDRAAPHIPPLTASLCD